MTDSLAYWVFGFALGGALTIALGKPLVEEHGRRILPLVIAGGAVLGFALGWALDGYIQYVRASATLR